MDKPNILWITVDATRKDRLSCYDYERETTPNLERIANKSKVFKNAISNSIWTLPSVASMFTGKYPYEHNLLNKINQNLDCNSIAELLKDKGYRTTLIGGVPWVYSSNTKRGFENVFNMG